jgi:hypothetical protein
MDVVFDAELAIKVGIQKLTFKAIRKNHFSG